MFVATYALPLILNPLPRRILDTPIVVSYGVMEVFNSKGVGGFDMSNRGLCGSDIVEVFLSA